jgi:hypothetical protein
MIFFDKFENRLKYWKTLRENLETHEDPIKKTIDFWNTAPISSLTCDPFNQTTWPEAWQLIYENNYCDFTKILAIYYTLSLTDRFSKEYFEIQIIVDQKRQEIFYVLQMNDLIIGYHREKAVHIKDLPDHLWKKECFPMFEQAE